MIHRRIDQIDRSNDVVGVVEPLDEVAQTLRCIGGEMVNVIELIPVENGIDQLHDRGSSPRTKRGTRGHIILVASAQVIEHDYLRAHINQVAGYMGSDESGAARYK